MEEQYKLNKLANNIYKANKKKGFWDKERNVGEMLMLIVTELAEAMEAHRGRGNTLDRKLFEDTQKASPIMFKEDFEVCIKDTFEDEISDALIRIFDLCGGLGIDLDFHVKNKLKYNTMRAKLHGKKY